MTRPTAPRSPDPAADDDPSSTSPPPDPAVGRPTTPTAVSVTAGPGRPVEGPLAKPVDRPDDRAPDLVTARPLAGDRPEARRRLPPRVVPCWRWTLLAAALPPLLLLVAVALVLPVDLPLVVGALWVLAGLMAVGAVIAVVVVPPIRYAIFWYALSDDELDVGHGVLFRRRTIVPMQRVQSLRTERGPLARWYRLTNVRVRTAAGSVVISGLELDEADRICASISRLANVHDDL